METTSLAAALCRAQGQMKKADESGKNSHFGSTYSTYEDLMVASREALANNGLSVVQYLDHKDGADFIITRLLHASGQEIVSTAKVYVKDASDVQKIGSFMTYIQRYNLGGICGIIGKMGADDDGNSLSTSNKQKEDTKVLPKAASERPPNPDVSARYPEQGHGFITQGQLNFLVSLLKGNNAKEIEICKRLNIPSLEYIPFSMANSALAFAGYEKPKQEKNFIPLPEVMADVFEEQLPF